MKRMIIALIGILSLSFIACEEVKDEIEKKLEREAVLQSEVKESFEIPATPVAGSIDIPPIKISTGTVKKQISDNESKAADVDKIIFDKLKLVLADQTGNFDFVESLSINITSGPLAGTTLASITDVAIPDGAKEIDLSSAVSGIDIKQIIDAGDFDLDIDIVSKEPLSEPVGINLDSNLTTSFNFEL